MGLVFSRLWGMLLGRSDENFKIIILGLNNAGKTTILYKLHLGEVIMTQPTIGSNVEEVNYKNIKFQVWDIGGQEATRATWATYFENAKALMFVLDSNDHHNLVVSKMELFNALLSEKLKDAVLLVLANKQDLAGAKDAAEIAEAMNLTAIKDRDWHIQGCCAATGEGLNEGMDWIASHLSIIKSASHPPH
eukprot:GHVN01100514.1.p1 GENE.GHVN01100514.1~~GHVN01100514.1.p1  ORF type:complete len:191 (-),score=35.67 GHVN01100514.1:65-637(-)